MGVCVCLCVYVCVCAYVCVCVLMCVLVHCQPYSGTDVSFRSNELLWTGNLAERKINVLKENKSR
jgi:hypothetical protein